MAPARVGHPEAPGSGDRPWAEAATPGDGDGDVAMSPSALLTPAQPIAVDNCYCPTGGTGDTAHSALTSPMLLPGFSPSSCHHAPTAPLETNTRCGNRHCPLLSTLWFLVMDDTTLSKKEDILAIKCMVRNT